MGRPASVPRSPVGQRIAAAREALGLSQQELADAIEVPLPNIAFWERRAPAPRAEILPRLSEVLGVSIDYILGNKPAKPRKPGPSGRARQLFTKVGDLPRHRQKQILDVVEALLAQAE